MGKLLEDKDFSTETIDSQKYIEKDTEQTLDENIEQNIEKNAEQTLDENIELNIEKDIEQTVNQNIELNIEKDTEQTSDENIELNIEKNTKQEYCESLVLIKEKKLDIKRVVIVLLLFVLLICLFIKSLISIKEKSSIKTFKMNISKAYSDVLIQNQEMEIIKINQEKDLKEKFSKRNTLDFNSEQIEKITNIYKTSDKKIAYLTFDDGPSSNVTPLILDILKQENIKATFFVLGLNSSWNKEIIKRMRNDGHYIANHTYSHRYEDIYKDYESFINEYNQCETAVREALEDSSYKTRIFRFPGGSAGGKHGVFKNEAKNKMLEQGIVSLDWNSLTSDSDMNPTKEKIMDNLKITTQGKNIVVVLMHDSSTKSITHETLTDVINYLREQGYEFGDLYELLKE